MSIQHKYNFKEKILFPKTRLKESDFRLFFESKTILITGASSGIGRALALRLAGANTHLLLVARSEDKLLTLQKEILQLGSCADVLVADLRKDEELNSVVQFVKQLEKLDIFINNAGKSIKRSLNDSLDRYHDFSRTMAINYEAPVKLSLALLPILKKNKGNMVNISALNVLMAPAPFWGAYQASKTAFDQWFRSYHAEIEQMGVKTTSIYLPLVRTPMIEPNIKYKNYPAMSADHVAKIICKCLVKSRKRYKPWWSIFGELGSFFFEKFWIRKTRRMVNK